MTATKISTVFILVFLLKVSSVEAQFNIRPYSQVYSENLRGSCVLFGNTSMNIMDADTVSTTKANETGDPLNLFGGLGYSEYGNDFENMQFTDIDATPANLLAFSMGASGWKYLADGSDQGTSWRLLNDPDRWIAGTASFGYGHSEFTTIPAGNITSYFVKTVTINDPALYAGLLLNFSYDDGIAIYVNGQEIVRRNLPGGSIAFNTTAIATNFTLNESVSLDATYFNPGANIIAVEIHQDNAASTNCFFDLSLTAIGRSTYNSSSADLILPAGTNTVKFARLYWGGKITDSVLTTDLDTLRHILIRKGTSGSYATATAPVGNVDIYEVTTTETGYQAYVDVTSFIQANGAGTYTIANLPASTGIIGDGGNYGGWAIVVAYENPSLNYNSVRIYDGYARVYDFGIPVIQSIELTGLNVPSNPLTSTEAVMSTMVWEGDANLFESTANPAGDYLKLNNFNVANAANPVSNFWNGSISKNGAFVTGTKNPDHFNQMGIDIDEMNVGVGYNIMPNDTSVRVEFGTEADQYFPSIFAFSIRMKEPEITLDKVVADANNNGIVDPLEELTYTLSGTNSGVGIAYNCFIVDSLPTNVNYVANSLEVVSAPGVSAGIKTDADDSDNAVAGSNNGRNYLKFYIGNNWTSTSGGELPATSSYILKFKVQANATPGSITNTARITANSQAGDVYVDDGTAIISPAGAPINVKLNLFTATLSGNNGLLHWTTESELNNDHFEIERSDDAIAFIDRGHVTGQLNSSTQKNYSYTDPINTLSGIIYYRLKMIDKDGNASYSRIIALKLNGSVLQDLSVFPNPFKDDIRIMISSEIDDNAVFRIISFDGKEMLIRKLSLQRGGNIIVLKDLQKLAAGSYILEVTTMKDKFIKKILKQ